MIDTKERSLSLFLIEMFTLSNYTNANIYVERIIFADLNVTTCKVRGMYAYVITRYQWQLLVNIGQSHDIGESKAHHNIAPQSRIQLNDLKLLIRASIAVYIALPLRVEPSKSTSLGRGTNLQYFQKSSIVENSHTSRIEFAHSSLLFTLLCSHKTHICWRWCAMI